MVLHRSGRAAGGLVTVAVVTAGLAASLGAGYTVAQATLQDSSAYVTKGTAVSHVNGESRRVDATSTGPALAENGDRVITRATPSGEVIAINQRTGAVTTIDRGTMSPTSSVTPKKAVIKAPDVVSSGTRSWLIDYDARAVRPMRNGVAVGGIDITGRPVDAAPGPDGSVLVLTREGELFRVATDNVVTTIDVDDAERAALTVAGSRTYLVTATGGVADVYGDGARKVATVPGVGPGPDGRMLAGSTQGSGTHVLIVSEAALAIVDPETGSGGELVALGTGAHILGRPVEYRGRVFVPDFDQHKLVVVDVARKAVATKPVDVPGTQRYFDLFVSGDKLWANDQYAQRLVQFDGATEHQIDKGPGNGVKPDPKPNTNPPKTPPAPGVPPPTDGTGNNSGGTKNDGNNGNPNRDTTGNGRDNGGATGDAKPELVAVPTFPDGTTVEDACGRLIELRLRCNQVSREDPAKESGSVLQTLPGAGAKVAVGGSVTVIFVGPAEVPTIADGTQPIDACTNAITPAGLTCAYAPFPTPADDASQFGTVAGTSPDAGTKVSNGQTVTIQYYDSFVMPDVSGKGGDEACKIATALSLTLPDAAGRPQTTHPQCDAVAGKSTDNGNKDAKNQVYEQQPTAGQIYKSGSKITLTYYNGQANLPDYSGNHTPTADATSDGSDCKKYFDCQVSDETRVPVDDQGNSHTEWIDTVAAMTDSNGETHGGSHDVGSTIRLIKYRGDNQVPDVSGKSPGDACDAIRSAGFACKENNGQPAPVSNSVVSQSPGPGATQGIGSDVTINYNGITMRTLNLWRNADDTVHIARADNQPNPPGFTLIGSLGRVYEMNQGNADWQLKEFTANCNNRTPNVLYSHGAPDGCMAGGGGASAAGLIVPDGDTCGSGSAWLYRISVKSGPDRQTITYNLARGNPGDSKAAAPASDYTEPLGCIFPP